MIVSFLSLAFFGNRTSLSGFAGNFYPEVACLNIRGRRVFFARKVGDDYIPET
jgi:hypothetical protein